MNWLDEFPFFQLLWYLLVNHHAKFGKVKSKTWEKKIPRNPEKREHIVARTVSRPARSWNESAGGRAKKAAGLHENHAGRATPNGCSRTRGRQTVFTAARTFICTNINPLIWLLVCVCKIRYIAAFGRCSKKMAFWISRSKSLKNNWRIYLLVNLQACALQLTKKELLRANFREILPQLHLATL